MKFAWDPSFSYQGLPITYKIEVLDDTGKNAVVVQENITDTSWILPEGLDPGKYFLRVSATDSEGHEQISLEYSAVQSEDGRAVNVHGLLAFVIE